MSKREAVIELHCAGRIYSVIIMLLKVDKSTVYHVVKRFKDLGTCEEDRHRNGRLRTARSKNIIKANKEKSKAAARLKLAKVMNVSVTSMKRTFKNDLKLLFYHMRKRQYHTLVQMLKR